MGIPNHYKPTQLNFQVQYREIAASEKLKELIALFWEAENTTLNTINFKVIPDGCIDFLSGLSSTETFTVSISLYNIGSITLEPGQKVWGVRFFPSAFTSIFHVTMKDLAGVATLPLNSIISGLKMPFAIEQNQNLEQKKALFEEFLIALLSRKNLHTDAHLLTALDQIYTTKGNIRIEDKRNFTVSPRQLRRIFDNYIGFSPKEFSKIVRMQYVIQNCSRRNFDIYDIGFFDEPHFIHEVKQFTGLNPKLLKVLKTNSE